MKGTKWTAAPGMTSACALLVLGACLSPAAAGAGIHSEFSGTGIGPGIGRFEAPAVPAAVEVESARDQASSAGSLAARLAAEHPEIPREAVARAFRFVLEHRDQVGNTRVVAIADFDRPSDEKRLSLISLPDGAVESYLVAHGRGSGERFATRFSNTARTHMSSLGVYLTGGTYQGQHGRSLKLRGMEATNSAAEARAIVLHGAAYVSDAVAAGRGMVGRSWGCPAVDYRFLDRVIDRLQGGAVLLIHRSGG